MPACTRQEEKRFASVYRSPRQEVATPPAIGSFSQWIAIRGAHATTRETSSSGSFSLELTRLLGDVADQLTSRCGELPHVFVRIASQNVTEDVHDVRRVLDRHFVSHCRLLRPRSTRRDLPDATSGDVRHQR
jgi:hypothetical protein